MKSTSTTSLRVSALLLVAGTHCVCASAQEKGSPTNAGAAHPPQHEKSRDMDTIHRMFNDTDKIKRTVKNTPKGVEATTESEDPKVVAMLQEHARAMQARLKNHQPIRAWDDLFAALFKNADKIQLKITQTAKGVRIAETSDDPYTVQIIHAHASAVTGFLHDGMMGMAKRHPAPQREKPRQPTEAAFLGKGDGIKSCPVTGEPIDKRIKAEINGRTIYFCCASCKALVQKNPSQYLPPKARSR